MANTFLIAVPDTRHPPACPSRSLGVLLSLKTEELAPFQSHLVTPSVTGDEIPCPVPDTVGSPSHFLTPPSTEDADPAGTPEAEGPRPLTPRQPTAFCQGPPPLARRPPEKLVLSPRALQLSPLGEPPRRPETPEPAFPLRAPAGPLSPRWALTGWRTRERAGTGEICGMATELARTPGPSEAPARASCLSISRPRPPSTPVPSAQAQKQPGSGVT